MGWIIIWKLLPKEWPIARARSGTASNTGVNSKAATVGRNSSLVVRLCGLLLEVLRSVLSITYFPVGLNATLEAHSSHPSLSKKPSGMITVLNSIGSGHGSCVSPLARDVECGLNLHILWDTENNKLSQLIDIGFWLDILKYFRSWASSWTTTRATRWRSKSRGHSSYDAM